MENEKQEKIILNEKIEIIKKEIVSLIPTLSGRPIEYIKEAIAVVVTQNGISLEQLKKLKGPTASVSLDNLNSISITNLSSSIDKLAQDIFENNLDKTGKLVAIATKKSKKSVTINFTIKENIDITTLPKNDALKIIERKWRMAFLAAGYDEDFLQRTGDSLAIQDSAPQGKRVCIDCSGKTFLESWSETVYNLFNTKNIEKTKEETEKTFETSKKANPESKSESQNATDFGTLSFE